MRVRDITAALEAFAPLSLQEKWDNSGLCIGSPDQEVHGVLLGFDCTPELIDEAVCVGADLVVTHHPLIFGGLKRIAPEDPVGVAVIKAVRAGVAVYAAHTTADKVPAGVSGAMARRLGLERVSVLEPDGTLLLDGAEDYVIKPFDMMALMVRMEKVLLRTGRLNRIYRAGDVELDDYKHLVYKAGAPVEVSPLEYAVLLYLMKHKNLTVSREQLLNEVWGFEYMGESRSVDVKISTLRRKLGLGDAIKTVQKLGYRLEDR